jgi:hypothetical protein
MAKSEVFHLEYFIYKSSKPLRSGLFYPVASSIYHIEFVLGYHELIRYTHQRGSEWSF